MPSTPDARLSLGLLTLTLGAIGAFFWLGFGDPPSRPMFSGEPLVRETRPEAPCTFVDITAQVGLDGFAHRTNGVSSIHDTVAPGVGLLDLNQDFYPDLVLLGGPGQSPSVSVFVNRGRDRGLVFEDVTSESDFTWHGHPQGVCAGDYDLDGDVDLFITAVGPNLLLENRWIPDGRLSFVDVTTLAGVAGGEHHARKTQNGHATFSGPPRLDGDLPILEFSTGASFGDFDRDRDLDLFVAGYVSYDPAFAAAAGPADPFRPTWPAQPHRLYRNEGNGSFVEITESVGLGSRRGKGLGAMFLQTDDRAPDIYVAHDDRLPNALFRTGQRQGIHRLFEQGREYGADDVGSGSGVAWGDADGDADPDLALAQADGVTLLLSRASSSGTNGSPPIEFIPAEGASDLTRRGPRARGIAFVDVDLDGNQDLVVAYGDGLPDDAGSCVPGPLRLFHNVGNARFVDVSETAGDPFLERYSGRGLVAGDLDLDGDLDLVLAQNNGPVVVLENRLPRATHKVLRTDLPGPDVPWRVLGRGDAIGTRMTVHTDRQSQFGELQSGGSYLSQAPLHFLFGLGRIDETGAERGRFEVVFAVPGLEDVEGSIAQRAP